MQAGAMTYTGSVLSADWIISYANEDALSVFLWLWCLVSMRVWFASEACGRRWLVLYGFFFLPFFSCRLFCPLKKKKKCLHSLLPAFFCVSFCLFFLSVFVFVFVPRLVGVVVKASTSRAEDPGLDLEIDTPVATLPGARR